MKQAWVEVNLSTLESNIRSLASVLRDPTSLMFVVKANAYGHGLVPISRCAAQAGVKWFAVAYLQEAIALRQVLPDVHVLVLGVVDPSDVPLLLRERIIPIVVSAEHGRRLGAASVAAGGRLPVHLKIDTGMGRLGFGWDSAAAEIESIVRDPGLDVQGICTHFAAVRTTNMTSARLQMDRFAEVAAAADRIAGRRLLRHVSSSRAFLYVEDWDFEVVRPGIALYGYGTGGDHVRAKTEPLLQWKTVISQVRSVPAGFPVGYYSSYITPVPTRLAVLSVGYADGFPRLLSNKGHVLIGGRRCPVVGRVSMNWITADLGPDSSAREGDEVVLIGRQGTEAIWADEMAKICGTIPYEILTDINAALERKYVR